MVRLDFFLRIFRLKKQQHFVSLTCSGSGVIERKLLREYNIFTCSGSCGVVIGAFDRSCVAPSSSLLRSMLVEPLLYLFSKHAIPTYVLYFIHRLCFNCSTYKFELTCIRGSKTKGIPLIPPHTVNPHTHTTTQCAYCEVSLDTLGKKFKDPEKRLIGFRVLRYDV